MTAAQQLFVMDGVWSLGFKGLPSSTVYNSVYRLRRAGGSASGDLERRIHGSWFESVNDVTVAESSA